MRAIIRTMGELAILYVVIVAIADVFLAKIPTLDWLALAFIFIFFTFLITNSVLGLLPSGGRTKPKVSYKEEDELQRLSRVVESALVRGDSESLKTLRNRINALALTASNTKAGKFDVGSNASYPDQFQEGSHDKELEPGLNAQISPLTQASQSMKDIETLLSKVEDWLNWT